MYLATDALFGMLAPFWQAVIGCLVALVVAVATVRLARRGRSRMRTAMLVTAAAVLAVMLLGALAM